MKKKANKKIKVSHSIDKKYLKLIDSDVKKKRFASRSHAIEYALQQMFDEENKEL
jgi:Arc/MetJ-type ribon-helix-helix transcriptional regulator